MRRLKRQVKSTGLNDGLEMRTQETELTRVTFRFLFYRTLSIVMPFTELNQGIMEEITIGLEGGIMYLVWNTVLVISRRRGQPG